MPCSLPCHCSSSSDVPDGNTGDKRGDNGFSDGIAKVHHCRLWPVEFLELPQEVYLLWGVTLVDGTTWGWAPSEVHNHPDPGVL